MKKHFIIYVMLWGAASFNAYPQIACYDPVELNKPNDNESFLFTLGNIGPSAIVTTNFKFSWSDLAAAYTLSFSSDANFSSSAARQLTKVVGASDTLTSQDLYALLSSVPTSVGPLDTIYWRVAPAGTEDWSAAQKFTLGFGQVAEPSPENQSSIVLDVKNNGNNKALEFAWEAPGGIPCELVFSLNYDLSNPFKRVELTTTTDPNHITSQSFTHGQMQEWIDLVDPENPGKKLLKRYKKNTIYWGVKIGDYLLDDHRRYLTLSGSRILEDVRGDEENTYDVSVIPLLDGTEAVWLANNLNTTKWLDGNEMGKDGDGVDYLKDFASTWANYPTNLKSIAGKYYRALEMFNVQADFAPVGWRLPTLVDFQNLFNAAINETDILSETNHGLNRLKIAGSDGMTNIIDNTWNMSMNGYGYSPSDNYVNINGQPLDQCSYGDHSARIILMVIDASKNQLQGVGWNTILQISWLVNWDKPWPDTRCFTYEGNWSGYAPVRLIYTGDDE
jgi:uncharacterized protein (TIGR02145 family)